jgi:exodeoxyribonuclease V beta subunit
VTEQSKEFSLLAEPPVGQVAIEASAGTGKTFTLAGLATRYLAEGVITASQLLMVTFTRAATEELRSRVRERLTEAAAVLAHEADVPEGDEFLAMLAHGDTTERLRRLRTALAEFDSATIITIHGFARQVHRTLGISASIDPDAVLVSDAKELVAEVCTDVLAQVATVVVDASTLPKLEDLVTATTEAVGRDGIDVQPDPSQPNATEAQYLFRTLVVRACDEFDRRRLRSSTLGFDDLLSRLRDAIEDPQTGPGVVASLRAHYKVALIDEFQDTDSIQWSIFSTLFGDPDTDNVLITVGDPKQAIYRFRGADIHAYLRAVGRDTGVVRETLATNWRSDEAVLEALECFFDGATFGDPAIRFHPVGVAEQHKGRRYRLGDDEPATLELRLAISDDIPRTKADPDHLLTPGAFAAVHDDLATYIGHLLDQVTIPSKEPGGHRPLRESDIAVLVKTNSRGEEIQQVLAEAGIPAVIAADGSVLDSAAATQLRVLLRALARPFDPRRVHAYALSWFAGWSAERVATAGDVEWATLSDELAEWAGMLARHPVSDVFAHVWAVTGVVASVLGLGDGDRDVTDLDHLAELLHDASPRGRSTVPGLLAVLESPPDRGGDTEIDGGVAARRIESDLDAVQIMTIWKAKGLEFPVVCVPGLWWRYDGGPTVFAEDPDEDDAAGATATTDPVRWMLDVAGGTTWPDEETAATRRKAAADERAGEELRLLYVALTRARHLTAVWWANLDKSAGTALARFLFARRGGRLDEQAFAADTVQVPATSQVASELQALVELSHHRIGVTAVGGSVGSPRSRPARGAGAEDIDLYGTAPFDRVLDRSINRWSFSSITDRVVEEHVDPYDESRSDGGAADEVGESPDGRGDPRTSMSQGSPEVATGTEDGYVAGRLTTLPAGTEFGSLVHSVLELVDFASDRPGETLDEVAAAQLDALAFDPTPRNVADATAADGRLLLVEGLRDAIHAPLGPLFDGGSLARIASTDRLNELSFDLRLASSGPAPTLRAIGDLVVSHLDAGDPMRSWALDLAARSTDLTLSGYLTGSIDLIARIGSTGAYRYVVADYKTNQLTGRGAEPSVHDYGATALELAMKEHDYPLQALLYSVALHRYLAWRVPDYQPDRHLGGAAYLFVRGMTPDGPDAGDGSSLGVFSWPVPPALVVALSALLSGGTAGASRG